MAMAVLPRSAGNTVPRGGLVTIAILSGRRLHDLEGNSCTAGIEISTRWWQRGSSTSCPRETFLGFSHLCYFPGGEWSDPGGKTRVIQAPGGVASPQALSVRLLGRSSPARTLTGLYRNGAHKYSVSYLLFNSPLFLEPHLFSSYLGLYLRLHRFGLLRVGLRRIRFLGFVFFSSEELSSKSLARS